MKFHFRSCLEREELGEPVKIFQFLGDAEEKNYKKTQEEVVGLYRKREQQNDSQCDECARFLNLIDGTCAMEQA